MFEMYPDLVTLVDDEETASFMIDHILADLRAGTMNPECQQWLAKCFDKKGPTRFHLTFKLRQGQRKNDYRPDEFTQNVEAFQRIRDEVWNEMREKIEREGKKARKRADTEAVKRATVTIRAKRRKKYVLISEATAYKYLAAAKAIEEAQWEADDLARSV